MMRYLNNGSIANIYPGELCDTAIIITRCHFTVLGLMNMHRALRYSFYSDSNTTSVSDIDYKFLRAKCDNAVIIDFDFRGNDEVMKTVIGRLSHFNNVIVISLATTYNTSKELRNNNCAGAMSHILKKLTAEEIKTELSKCNKREGFDSEVHPSSFSAQSVLDRVQLYMSLTFCEKILINSILKGISLTQFSRNNSKSIKTVSSQKKSAMKKLGVCNLMELNNSYRRIVE